MATVQVDSNFKIIFIISFSVFGKNVLHFFSRKKTSSNFEDNLVSNFVEHVPSLFSHFHIIIDVAAVVVAVNVVAVVVVYIIHLKSNRKVKNSIVYIDIR
jgi:hypothetical protein